MPRLPRSSFAIITVTAVLIIIVFWENSRNANADLADTMERHGLTAGNIAYGRAGSPPEVAAINAPVGIVRPFYSLSKPITAAVALHVLNLDQEIEGATVKQLLQHSGGWDRAIAGDPVTQLAAGSDCTRLPVPEKQFEPGDHYAYSNLGYCLLGRAIAEETGKTYQESVSDLFPETETMGLDPALGPAGGWSGTAKDYFRFASRPVAAGTGNNPISRPNDIPYGLGWAIGPDFVTHFGALRSNFSVVVKQGDFVAVGIFDGRPKNDAAAARDLRSALLQLK